MQFSPAGLNCIFKILHDILSISFCICSKNRDACAPFIWVWWNWKETVRVVLNHARLYLPQIINGLLNMPLYIPTALSISYCVNVELPITIL